MSKVPKQPTVPPQDESHRKNQVVVLETSPNDQIRIVQSGLSELANAKKIINSLGFDSSAFANLTAAAKRIDLPKLDPSVIENLSTAMKAFQGLGPNSSIFDDFREAGKTIQASMSSAVKASIPGHVRSERQPSNYLATNASRSKAILTPADFGVVLREARKAMGLTQQQFADAAGVGRRFVSECESGKPRLEFGKVIQVANAAGIDLLAQRR